MYFFYAFGTCVSPRRIFFTPWAPASCAGVFILRVCGNRTCTFTASVFSYPHIVHFFWKVHFWTAPVETKITFLLQVYFGSTCFPKVKRTFNCFKIVRVSTGFGELKLSWCLNHHVAWSKHHNLSKNNHKTTILVQEITIVRPPCCLPSGNVT